MTSYLNEIGINKFDLFIVRFAAERQMKQSQIKIIVLFCFLV